MSGVLLFGNVRKSLTLARELAAAGHEVHCGVDELSPFLFASRAVSNAFQHADPTTAPDRAVAQVADYLDRHREIDTLIPISEIATRLIVRNRDRFPSRVRIGAVTPALLEACIDKEYMFQLCERVGAPVAARRIVSDHESLREAVAAIGRPCIVKPVDSAAFLFGHKAVLLDENEDFDARLPRWPEAHRTLCVQRYVSGARHDISFGAYKGRMLGAADCTVLHTDTADGTGYTTGIVSTPPHPGIVDATERLIRALDYTGVGDIEFVLDDATGELTFIELNPRLSASYKAAAVAGIPIWRWFVEIAHGAAPQPLPVVWPHVRNGRTVWTKGAVSGLLRRRRDGELGLAASLALAVRILREALTSRDMVFAWSDPAPALWDFLHPVLTRLGVHSAWIEPERDVTLGDPNPLRSAA